MEDAVKCPVGECSGDLVVLGPIEDKGKNREVARCDTCRAVLTRNWRWTIGGLSDHRWFQQLLKDLPQEAV